MANTTVVNIKSGDDYDIYIGRANRYYHLPESVFHNPFKRGRDGTKEEVIAKYEAYLLSRPDLMELLPELKGKRLACWCKPAACHGDVLARLADALGGE